MNNAYTRKAFSFFNYKFSINIVSRETLAVQKVLAVIGGIHISPTELTFFRQIDK